MRCNAGVGGVADGGSEDNKGRITNDPEIKALNMKIERRKMELERSNDRLGLHDGFTDYDTVTTGNKRVKIDYGRLIDKPVAEMDEISKKNVHTKMKQCRQWTKTHES